MSLRRSDQASGASAFHLFTRALWFEKKIADDYSTGMTESQRATVRSPAGFVRDELDFGSASVDPCNPGCGCTVLRSSQGRRGPGRRRTGRYWQALAAAALANVAQAA